MPDFQPLNLRHTPNYTQFEDASGLEYEVYGGESRLPVAFEIAANSAAVVKLAEGLIRSFIKFDGTYAVNHCEVLADPEDDGSLSLIRFSFESASDPHEFGYTYYDVYVATARSIPTARRSGHSGIAFVHSWTSHTPLLGKARSVAKIAISKNPSFRIGSQTVAPTT